MFLTGLLFSSIAALYSSIGHAGASGYLAVMALLSFSPETIKPTSLILNITVALISSVTFLRQGYFDRKIFMPLVLTSIPAAYVGGYLELSPVVFRTLAGIFLVLSSLLLLTRHFLKTSESQVRQMSLTAGLASGSVIGFFSGLIGVGGGIFLSPILILLNWTDVRKASGIAALFILVNSVSGLAGHYSSLEKLDPNVLYWILAVAAGGFLGSWFGTRKFDKRLIISCLFLVLFSAGIKFIFIDN